MLKCLTRYIELLVFRPTKRLFGQFNFICAEWLTMCFECSRFVRTAVTDNRMNIDQRRFILLGFGGLDSLSNGLNIITIWYIDGLPTIGFVTLLNILVKGDAGWT